MEAGDPAEYEDTGGAQISISPLDNVYSYFMFMVPIEDFKSAKAANRGTSQMSFNTTLAYIIVFVSFFLQFVLLVAIFKQTVVSHVAWRDSVVQLETGQCNQADSLCVRDKDGRFSCAPPTIKMSGRWPELDLDGDGIWTFEEAKDSQDDLKCKYAVDPVEVFNVFKKFLIKREKIIFIEPGLREGKFIREAYFKYASGDIIMCGYRSTDMCANLLQRGVFDAPLRHGTVPRVGKTIDSALDYCFDLLEGGGTCERTLPSTYAVWRKSSEEQCGGAEYSPIVYSHPKTGTNKSMLEIDYGARRDYNHAERSPLFVMYKSCIIGIYLLAMFQELRDIFQVLSWILRFKKASELREPVTVTEEGKYEINGITIRHRAVMSIFMVLRIGMLCLLSTVGISFLLKETDEVDLLLNGLGLIFVVEISPLCYSQLLDPALRNECENINPMVVPGGGLRCLEGRPAVRDLLWLLVVIVTLITIVEINFYMETTPVNDALDCTCLSHGLNCVEAKKFNKAFWDDYWLNVIPKTLADIQDLELASNSSATSAAESQPTTGTAGPETHSFAYNVGRVVVEHWKHRKSEETSMVPWPLLGTVTSFLGPSWGMWGSAVSAFSRRERSGEHPRDEVSASSTLQPERLTIHHRKRHRR